MQEYDVIRGEGKTIEEARKNCLETACNAYALREEDFEIEIVQEPKKKLFGFQNAIVAARVKQKIIEEKKLEQEERIRKEKEDARIRKEQEEARIQKEKEEERLRREEAEKAKIMALTNKYIPMLREVAHIFPEIFLGNFMAIYYFVMEYNAIGNSQKEIESLGAIFEDLIMVWERVTNDDFSSEEYKKEIELLNDIMHKYEDTSHKDIEFDSWACYGDLQSYYIGTINLIESRSLRYYNLFSRDITGYTNYDNSFLNSNKIIYEDESVPTSMIDENKQNSRLFILARYLRELMLIPLIYRDIRLAKMVENNSELSRIIKNSRENGIVLEADDKTYNVYQKYYPDAVGELLEEPLFRNVSNMVYIMNTYMEDYQKFYNELKGLKIDTEEILKEIKKNNVEKVSVFDYIRDNYLEKGKFDVIMAAPNHGILWYNLLQCFCVGIIDYYDNVETVIAELFYAGMLNIHENDYYNKYCLLHPNIEKKTKAQEVKALFYTAETGIDFENALKELYICMGYNVQTTKTTGDQGADLVIEKDGVITVVQAKYYTSQVGNSAVQEVVAAINYYGATKGIVITNNSFTRAAYDLASANAIELIDGSGLDNMLKVLV